MTPDPVLDEAVAAIGGKLVPLNPMRVVVGFPPNYAALVKAFPSARSGGTIFCYGDTIFNPGRGLITPSLQAHEQVHSVRQFAMGIDAWWDRYIADVQFRFDEELIAHQAEFAKVKDGPPMLSVTQQRRALAHIAGRLAGQLYGNIVSLQDAQRMVLTGARQ